jgi:hypothetical protein
MPEITLLLPGLGPLKFPQEIGVAAKERRGKTALHGKSCF